MPQQDVGTLAAVRTALAASKVFVSHSLVDPSGRPLRGTASIAPDLPPAPRVRTPDGALLDPSPVAVPLDAAGSYTLRLDASSQCNPPGVFYLLGYAGFKFRFLAEVDDQDNRPAPLPATLRSVGGTVIDPAGTPVPGVVVALTGYPEQEQELLLLVDRRLVVPLPLHAETNNLGQFSFNLFTKASYVDRAPRFRVSAGFNVDYVVDSPSS